MPSSDRGQREGLVELLLVLAVLALGAAGAVALWGDELRALAGGAPAQKTGGAR